MIKYILILSIPPTIKSTWLIAVWSSILILFLYFDSPKFTTVVATIAQNIIRHKYNKNTVEPVLLLP